MTTKPIQPGDVIYVVDYQTEEIYEMCAGEFAEKYSELDFQMRFDANACGWYLKISDPVTGSVMNTPCMEDQTDATYDMFLRQFSAAASNESVSWFKTRRQAELNFLIYDHTR